jgi:predicted 2-oxoglutarate/Fe(II)-dependent dioxygenase YbiX
VTSIMQDREIAELRAALEVARRDEADAAVRAKVAEARVKELIDADHARNVALDRAEARVEVLRTALASALMVGLPPHDVSGLSMWASARAALGVDRGTAHE